MRTKLCILQLLLLCTISIGVTLSSYGQNNWQVGGNRFNDNTGPQRIGSTSNTDIQIVTFGQPRVYIKTGPVITATLVGIGTTSPQTTLDVNGYGRFNGNLIVNGNLGIGTSTPGYLLDVIGNGHFSSDLGVDGDVGIRHSLNVIGGGQFLNGLDITGNSVFRTGLTVNGGLTVGGVGAFVNGLNVTGAGSFTSTLKVGAYTLPATDGTSGQVLKTNGSGTLAWSIDSDTKYTAGTGINITGTTISSTLTGTQWTTTGSHIYYNTGNVGIGTATPSFKLDVSGAGRFTSALRVGAYTLPATDGAANQVLKTDGAGNLAWSNDNNTTYSAGNGIDVNGTTITNTAPDQVVNLSSGSGINVTGTYPNFNIASTNISSQWATNGSHIYYNGGNVGVGTATPAYKLDISGTGRFSNPLTIGTYTLPATDGTSGQVLKTDGAGVLSWSNDNDHNFSAGSGISISGGTIANTAPDQVVSLAAGSGISVSGAYPNFTITNTGGGGGGGSQWVTTGNNIYYSAGKVGIGTTTPAYPLDVNGDINLSSGKTLRINGSTVFDIDAFNNIRVGRLLDSSEIVSAATAVGMNALSHCTKCVHNTAYGFSALENNGAGALYNTAVGSEALQFNTGGSGNAAFGFEALQNSNADQNTGIGFEAMPVTTTGGFNTGVGGRALFSNTTGAENTAVGASALQNNATGKRNTAVGNQTLIHNFAGDYNTALGYLATLNGSQFNSTAIGANAISNASNKIRLGDANVTVVESAAGSWTTSDARFKSNVKEDVKGLEFIKLLRPVVYNFDAAKYESFLTQHFPDSIKAICLQKRKASMNRTSAIRQTGFIAQEVEAAAKKIGYDFNGVHAPENPNDNYSLSYEKLVVPAIKAIQELSQQNDDLKKEVAELKDMVTKLVNGQLSTTNVSLSDIILEQNIPNPFDQSTSIKYFIPSRFGSAQMVVTDNAGRGIKTIPLTVGSGVANVDAALLSSGAYNYSLIVDGKIAATKKMVLAK